MNTETEVRPVGASILALLCVLVSLLGLSAAGSYYLIGFVKDALDQWAVASFGMLVLAVLYLVMAWMLWSMRSSVRWFAPVLMILLAALALLDILQDEVLDLAAALLFFLAAAVNMAVIAWLRIPATRKKFSHNS